MSAIWAVVVVVVAIVLTVVSVSTLIWMMHAWQTPATYRSTRYPRAGGEKLSFSIIVPCRNESETVMSATLGRLLAQTHRDLEVIFSVGDDDIETVANARRLAARDPRIQVSVNRDLVKNKPRQLNTALTLCRNEIVGIVDAESLTAPGLLEYVSATFAAECADVVQGAVHLINYRARWFTLRNCLEYRTWFRSRLHRHAQSGFIPLGGNTVFLRRSLLHEVGGWDGDCLTEDCELGVRLSVLRKKVVCVYDPGLTTLEEAPVTVRAFVKQRTRWALGFMQVLAKSDWRSLPTRRERLLAWWTLVQQHAMAFSGLALPIMIITVLFAELPLAVAMITFLPLIPTVLMIGFEILILREFGQDMSLRMSPRDYLIMIISTPFYQVLLATASLRAAWKYLMGNFAWEKTAHEGSHLATAETVLTASTSGAPV